MSRIACKHAPTFSAELGYGNREQGPIPAGSVLVFEVELISDQVIAGLEGWGVLAGDVAERAS